MKMIHVKTSKWSIDPPYLSYGYLKKCERRDLNDKKMASSQSSRKLKMYHCVFNNHKGT